MRPIYLLISSITVFLCLFCFTGISGAENGLTGRDRDVKELAENCREEVVAEMKNLLESNTLTVNQLFDTFYIPIPDTYPPKYHTQYDRETDKVLRIILDKYLEKKPYLVYVVASPTFRVPGCSTGT
ncbi:MAG: hypothetical protein R6X08_04565, partial [Desulfosalsimonadaceae bacterium]